MIELADMIGELRGELGRAIVAGADEDLRFDLGTIELEVAVAVERQGTTGTKVKFWVLEIGADGTMTKSSTQRLKLSLQPRLAGSSAPPQVSDDATDRER